ncbi:uncharacterized protein K460DRAFT_326583 [Cucurbitaria berberidis CBS 394.84]|uniref:Gfd2/YDR514C-like C-terminal domain-containing protein n=1 Tax=Cucurbitaria berberidis CBS 394.84 TaxID=1168544 RepID=A0A9P4LBX6_9PLEO|nr:uncharacterized protein K460DRAFT_326583 [Cucurbitaria berberidis CBS 394.84]KAF1850071.1 hypothetical protein K460DRAFT_326583 [Cucurbitaria berberidis CBS 394.84]
MPISWATIAAAPPPPLTPTQRMQELQAFYAKQSLRFVLSNALGFHDAPGATERISPLMEHTVVVGIDTEAWTKNTDEMTEIGLAVFERKDMLGNEGGYEHLGDFGEELLKKITFHHLRIVETAHLKTSAEWMKGAEGNRFGHSRFVTFAEARVILDSLFSQPIDSSDPELKGCKKPVVLLGHAMYHDEENIKKSGGLEYDLFKYGTIVKEVDTQPLAKATHTWFDQCAPNNDVGLDTLTKRLGFEHEDAHTACNDAARTVISAIQMVLPKQCREGREKDMQAVAWEIEEHSRDTPSSTWGSKLCCTRCGGRDHQDKEGERCTVPVHCKACAQFDVGKEEEHWTTHMEMYCPHIANYKAWTRRRDDALRKHNPFPPGPPEGSHPSSNFVVPLYARVAKAGVPLSSTTVSSYSSASAKSNDSSSSRGTGGSGSSDIVYSSGNVGYAPVARIVSFQSSGRGRGGGRGLRGAGGTRGGSVLSRDRRREDEWRPFSKW